MVRGNIQIYIVRGPVLRGNIQGHIIREPMRTKNEANLYMIG